MGRPGVDIYPLQTGVPLERVESFGNFLGWSATEAQAAYEKCRKALQLPTVQDLVVGRSLLHPASSSVEAPVDSTSGLL
ncbi:hypothetical protein HLK59_02325 [Streptomyces sp. S3(2020)]|nr:hypothetical protein [Streptomyces sp. S3(2020)]